MNNLNKNLITDFKKIIQKPTRDGFGEAMVDLGKIDEKIVVACGDLKESTRVEAFSKVYPERFFEMGVAEQNMMGVAAGLALEGLTAFTVSYATFNPGRNWDQMRVSVCYNRANVKVIGCHSGISVGPDGATHQALEDIAMTRALPGLTVVVPCDSNETYRATVAISKMIGPVYMRFGRSATPIFTKKEMGFEIGKAITLRDGKDLTIIGAGPILFEALMTAEELEKEKGLSIRVINLHTIKPIDVEAVERAAIETGGIVTVEEHQLHGGVGSAICEVLSKHAPVPVEMVGMPNSFGESGDPIELLKKYGMDKEAVKKAVLRLLKRK